MLENALHLENALQIVFTGWVKASNVTIDFDFTSTMFTTEFTDLAVESLNSYLNDYVSNRLYQMLKVAYPVEDGLSFEIDNVGRHFVHRLERSRAYTGYQHRKTVFRACNLAVNGDSSNRKRQVLTVCISKELWRLHVLA